MPTRIIAAVSAAHQKDGVEHSARQGEEVELTAEAEALLEEQNALVPQGWASFAEFSEAKMDAYRAGRGDIEAGSRINARLAEGRSGGIVDISGQGGSDTASYIEWLTNESPTVDEVLAQVGDDPARAKAMLEAENNVTGGSPRKGVVEGLEGVTG